MKNLQKTDPQIYTLIKEEEKRQKDVLEMIPSENYTSQSVMETMGSVLINKYSEGYPQKRYYQGNKVIDSVEELAQERAKKLFGVPYANVQPYSGSPANAAIYMAVLKPGQKLMGLALDHGGHITHGLEVVGFSGTFYKTAHYKVSQKTRQLDYDEVEKDVLKEKPDLLICGFTAYSRIIDWAKFRQIADKAGCWLMADMSHITGLVAGGVHPSPVPYVDVVMTTTHKTLRGPRGAIIMVTDRGIKKDPELPKRINTAVFPGLQGGPHDNQTAAIAVALKEASTPKFKKYAEQIVKNAKALSEELVKGGLEPVSGGTDNHLVLVDLQNKKVSGKIAAEALEYAGIVLNYNLVPYDPMPPMYTSGIRMGTPALTTRGMKEKDMEKVGKWMVRAIKEVEGYSLPEDKTERVKLLEEYRAKIAKNQNLTKIATEIKKFIVKFPVP
ncbi:MAG TPA: serine hydroxymethyltransferase [Candidatus Saccharimonadales bacterium]|nr:serine hydroxymethyltransferase [Candidatus Saccharimonadales bacterium]